MGELLGGAPRRALRRPCRSRFVQKSLETLGEGVFLFLFGGFGVRRLFCIVCIVCIGRLVLREVAQSLGVGASPRCVGARRRARAGVWLLGPVVVGHRGFCRELRRGFCRGLCRRGVCRDFRSGLASRREQQP